MKIKYFRHGFKMGWEWNLIAKHWSLRIGSKQIAFWRDYVPVFNLLDVVGGL